MSVRVFVANDHGILRGALSAVINMQSDMEVVGEGATGLDAEIGIKETEPDVVLMDIGMSNGGGLDAIAALNRLRSGTRTVVLTFQEELGYIRAAGTLGYVVKRVMNTELLSAIRAVAQELTFADASIDLESVRRSTRPSPTDSAAYAQETASLTDRELRLQRTCARRARPSRALIDPG
jgi:DNA-binding NarL/FixJ family response regulator